MSAAPSRTARRWPPGAASLTVRVGAIKPVRERRVWAPRSLWLYRPLTFVHSRIGGGSRHSKGGGTPHVSTHEEQPPSHYPQNKTRIPTAPPPPLPTPSPSPP